jgi:tetratricopeptide (TPR) repeat protein
MSLWSTLFGHKKRRRRSHRPSESATATPAPPTPPTECRDKDLCAPAGRRNDSVWVIDWYGRQQTISAKDWARSVLPSDLHFAWDKPDALASTIELALIHRCAADVLDAARHLHEIDPNKGRAVCLLADSLLYSGHDLEAERILDFHVQQHGEEAGVVATRAIIEYARGRSRRAEELLWRSIELDPNGARAVGNYAGLSYQRGGVQAEVEAMTRIAALPGSWRADVALVWVALNDKNLEVGLKHAGEALRKAPRPAPIDLLESLAHALISQGHLPEVVNLVAPHFDAKLHGLPVGSALIKTYLDLGQIDFAARILTQLREFKTLMTESALNYWEAQIADSRHEVADPVSISEETFGYMTFEGPIWLPRNSSAAELFPAKSTDGPSIALLPFSADAPEGPEKLPREWGSLLSGYSRATPLFLLEQLEFHTNARAFAIVPWVRDAGVPGLYDSINDARAATLTRNAPLKSEFVITGHFANPGRAGQLAVRLIRVSDGNLVQSFRIAFDIERPEHACNELSKELRNAAMAQLGVKANYPPGQYRLPSDIDFLRYLLSCDDLLALRCSAQSGVSAETWLGERLVIERALMLAVEYPRNVPVRILLAQIVHATRAVRPSVPPEFKEKLSLLERQHPLSEPTHSVLQSIINAATA